jgi:hypothetical protein
MERRHTGTDWRLVRYDDAAHLAALPADEPGAQR